MTYPKTITVFSMPIKNEFGDPTGDLVMTREITARDVWNMRIMRKLFWDNINGCKESFRTPIIEDDHDLPTD